MHILQDGSEIEVNPTVRGTRSVEIHDPIKVNPEILYFPWDPATHSSHQYKLKVNAHYKLKVKPHYKLKIKPHY